MMMVTVHIKFLILQVHIFMIKLLFLIYFMSKLPKKCSFLIVLKILHHFYVFLSKYNL